MTHIYDLPSLSINSIDLTIITYRRDTLVMICNHPNR
jgi:hypothetical protein